MSKKLQRKRKQSKRYKGWPIENLYIFDKWNGAIFYCPDPVTYPSRGFAVALTDRWNADEVSSPAALFEYMGLPENQIMIGSAVNNHPGDKELKEIVAWMDYNGYKEQLKYNKGTPWECRPDENDPWKAFER